VIALCAECSLVLRGAGASARSEVNPEAAEKAECPLFRLSPFSPGNPPYHGDFPVEPSTWRVTAFVSSQNITASSSDIARPSVYSLCGWM